MSTEEGRAPSSLRSDARGGATTPRTLPGPRLGLWVLGAALVSAFAPRASIVPWLLVLNTAIVLLFLWDRARLLRARVTPSRDIPERVRTDVSTPYYLRLESTQGPRLRLRVAELPCPGFELTPGQHSARLSPGSTLELASQLRAAQHGRGQLTGISLRKESVLGLCAVQEELPCPHALRAYPDLPLGRGSLIRMERRDLGVSPQRMFHAEQGSELAALREYVPSDSLRSIDWKATARRHRPITRAYQPERSQTLWIVLDASRAMTLPVDGGAEPPRTRFAAALSAALELADAALTGGDRVGLLAYGQTARLTVLPRRGRAHFLHLVERLLGVQPEPCELAVQELVHDLVALAPKRSLVVLFTDLDNEGDLRALASHARVLSRRHLTLCFSLEARQLRTLSEQPSQDEAQIYRKLAALTLREQRTSLARTLREQGMPVLESSDPALLARTALRRYREIKQSGRL